VCERTNKKCPHHDPSKPNDLAGRASDLYQVIADLYNVDTLVTGDKNLSGFLRLTRGYSTVPILIIENPFSLASSVRFHKIPAREKRIGSTVVEVCNTVNSIYEGFIKNIPEFFVLDFDYFIAYKWAVLKHLCSKTGLEYRPEALEFWNFEYHTIGGNRGAYTHIMNPVPRTVIEEQDKLYDCVSTSKEYYQQRNYLDLFTDLRYKKLLTAEEMVAVATSDLFKTYSQLQEKFMKQLTK